MDKTETSFKKLLREMDDTQIRQYYKDLEWTAFPVLIIKEYQKRFDDSNKTAILNKLKIQTELAKQKSIIIKQIAAKNGTKIGNKILKQASDTVSYGMTSAKKMAHSPEQSLVLLEKLAELNKKGIITNKEFQEKKRNILKRI